MTQYDLEQRQKREATERAERQQERERCDGCAYQSMCVKGLMASPRCLAKER